VKTTQPAFTKLDGKVTQKSFDFGSNQIILHWGSVVVMVRCCWAIPRDTGYGLCGICFVESVVFQRYALYWVPF